MLASGGGPDNDLRPGHRRYNFVWYRPASEADELPRLLTDETGRTHAMSIPPPLIARDVVATMRGRPRTCWRRSSSICSRSVRSLSCSDLRPRSAAYGFGHVAVLGDAASWRVRMSARVSPRRPRTRWRLPAHSTQNDDVEAA